MHNTVGSEQHILDGISREEIKISDVKITPLTYKPSDGSYVHECGPVVITKYDVSIIEIMTDQGIVGIGPGPNWYDEGKLRSIAESIIGKNPFDVESLGLPAGFDVACWDIIGRIKGLPVYKLLALENPPNPDVRVYASGGVLWTYYDKEDGKPYGVEALIEEALSYQELGFDTFKWRPGTDWEEAGIDAVKLGDICRQLRDAVGPDFNLGLEKKGYDSWTFEECLEIAPVINDLDFLFFEQPMGDEGPAQFDDYLEIKSAMPRVMLWGGERLGSLRETRPWLENRIYDAVQTDCFSLGITENWKIGRAADDNSIKLVPHNWSSSLGTMCNTHLVAALPNGHMCEFFMYPNDFRYGLFKEPYRPINGVIKLPDKPGFGMELVDNPEQYFPYIPGPSLLPNPRFPHAWARAQQREAQVRRRYQAQNKP